MRVPEEPVCIDIFRQNPVFTSLHLKSPVHVHRLCSCPPPLHETLLIVVFAYEYDEFHNSSDTQRNREHCQKLAGKEKISVIACTKKTNLNKLVSGIVKKLSDFNLQMKLKTTILCREKACKQHYVAFTHIDDLLVGRTNT
jgi:hypothetical protein